MLRKFLKFLLFVVALLFLIGFYTTFFLIACNMFTHCIAVADWRFVLGTVAGLSFHNMALGYMCPYVFADIWE